MNAWPLPIELRDQDFRAREPQPIAAVMCAVLAQHGLQGALPTSAQFVDYRTRHARPPAELAVA